MDLDPRAIANEFLELAESEGVGISPLKLQKLLYYAYGWCMAIKGERLFADGVQAWKYGPVVPSIYHEFKIFGNDSITSRATEISLGAEGQSFELKPMSLDEAQSDVESVDFARQLIKRIWDVYKKYSGVQLSNATHADGTPWSKTIADCGGHLRECCPIDDNLIKDYFVAQAQQSS